MGALNARFRDRPRRGIPLRAVAPNAVTALALCFGLSAVRFAIGDQWELAMGAVIVAGVLDGLDGRIARLLKGESRFGAELDSLSDVIAFGVSPAVVLYLWSLQYMPQFGWTIALAHAVCCALRLARFNAQIDATEQPRKAAGFLTGIPAPAGAGLAFVPIYLWLATGHVDLFRTAYVVAPWTAMVALLMVSSVPTYGWSSLRLRRGIRFGALVVIGLLGGALVSAPWPTLSIIALLYLASIPLGIRAYARVKRRTVAERASPATGAPSA
ncbi:MAG: CDP-alcohol phosphatidyltransferase family protein [Sphingomonas oligoaromativorans]